MRRAELRGRRRGVSALLSCQRAESSGHLPILSLPLRRRKALFGSVAFLLVMAQLGLVTLFSVSAAAEIGVGRLRLAAGTGQLAVEVASTHEELARGLMFRRSLAADAGMLFLLPREGVASFWMANTTIPLSVAFLDRHGTVLEIHDLEPLDTRIVSSESARVCFALEVNRDWFVRHGVRPGEVVRPEKTSWQELAEQRGRR